MTFAKYEQDKSACLHSLLSTLSGGHDEKLEYNNRINIEIVLAGAYCSCGGRREAIQSATFSIILVIQ